MNMSLPVANDIKIIHDIVGAKYSLMLQFLDIGAYTWMQRTIDPTHDKFYRRRSNRA